MITDLNFWERSHSVCPFTQGTISTTLLPVSPTGMSYREIVFNPDDPTRNTLCLKLPHSLPTLVHPSVVSFWCGGPPCRNTGSLDLRESVENTGTVVVYRL